MLICTNCKYQNPDGTRYCQRCGINLGDALPKRAGKRTRFLGGWRYDLLSGVEGRVLELGVRSGPNFPYYENRARVIATDAYIHMMGSARQSYRKYRPIASLSLADAQRLPFADDSFDAVVATLVFCSIPDPVNALQEVARVLRPGGRYYAIDHVRSDQPVIGAVMDVLAPAWKIVTFGCNLNRHTEDLIREAGFTIREQRSAVAGIMRWFIAEPPESASR